MKRPLALLLTVLLLGGMAACTAPPQPELPTSSMQEVPPLTDSSQLEILPAESSESASSGLSSDSSSSEPSETAQADGNASSQTGTASSASEPEGASSASSQPAAESTASQAQPEVPPSAAASDDGEMRGVWISYLELTTLLEGKSASAARTAIEDAFDRIADYGLNTVFFQVRPFSDALYRSDYFPWSHILTGTQGVDPGYDPLAVAIEAAHARGLELHAWLNPYRVRASSKPALSADNPAAAWWNGEETGGVYVVESGGGLYYNPAIPEVRELIVNGVREIIENYAVDGIHFDDYFYPHGVEDSFDTAVYAASGSSLSLGDWRRSQVNALIERVYATIKNYDSSIRFGISPSGNIDNTYGMLYADVYTWMSEPGYIDYICPQVYWGFGHSTQPFAETVNHWASLVTAPGVDFYVGIAGYRIGEEGEWSETGDLLMRQVQTARKANRYAGFSVYSYTSLFVSDSQVHRAEQQNLQRLLG